MGNPTGFYVSADNLNWCEREVSDGRFSTFSEILDFSLRLYLIHIREGISSIPKLPRTELARKTARVNPWVLEQLLSTGLFEKSEVADYAISYLREKWYARTRCRHMATWKLSVERILR